MLMSGWHVSLNIDGHYDCCRSFQMLVIRYMLTNQTFLLLWWSEQFHVQGTVEGR
jgi:hypothetical protein